MAGERSEDMGPMETWAYEQLQRDSGVDDGDDQWTQPITAEQHDILRHALGLGRGEHRNHFVTGPGGTDHQHCEALVAAGLMEKRPGTALSGWDDVYSVTVAGRAVARGKPSNVAINLPP